MLYSLFPIVVILFFFTVGDDIKMEMLVGLHHQLYVKLFGETMKPKHHHMLHYPQKMRDFGPIKHLWAMRFESKHHIIKQTNLTCKKNILKTLAKNESFRLSNFLNSVDSIFDETSLKKYNLENFGFQNIALFEELKRKKIECVDCLQGIKENYAIFQGHNEFGLMDIFLIRKIILSGGKKYFMGQICEDLGFDYHLGCNKINITEKYDIKIFESEQFCISKIYYDFNKNKYISF